MSLNLAILGSTRGSNLEPLYRLIQNNHMPVELVLVMSDKENALILEQAKRLQIATLFVSAKGMSREDFGEKLNKIFFENHIDLIVLIGFMRILAANVTQQWPGHIINVHPSLLPKHAGLMDLNVHEAVIAAGDTESGCSVHLVEEEVDAGKILVQKRCVVTPNETPQSLKAKVQSLEVPALLEAIELFC